MVFVSIDYFPIRF